MLLLPHMPEPPIRHSYRFNEIITHMSTRWNVQVCTAHQQMCQKHLEALNAQRVLVRSGKRHCHWFQLEECGSTSSRGSSPQVKLAGGSLPTAQLMR